MLKGFTRQPRNQPTAITRNTREAVDTKINKRILSKHLLNKTMSQRRGNMASKKLLDGLNKLISMDLRLTIQYMWQYVMAIGVEGLGVREVFREIAMQEMKHAESFAERLYYLGGVPTTTPMEVKVGNSLKEMAEVSLATENEAIELSKGLIRVAGEEGDSTTAFLIQEILEETEEHADKFKRMLA
jgi:bacterioferritin